MENKKIKKFYQHYNKQYYYLPHALGTGAPTSIPEDAGLMYIDISNGDIYISVAKSQVSDWKLITNTSGSSVQLKTNGNLNPEQNILDLQQGKNVVLTDNGLGTVTIDANPGQSTLMLDFDELIQDAVSTVKQTSLFFDTEVGKSYSFKALISYKTSGNPTIGLSWGAWDALGTYSYNSYYYQVWDSSGLLTYPALDVTVAPSVPIQTDTFGAYAIAIVEGVLTECTQAGKVTISFNSNSSLVYPSIDVVILSGSTLIVNEITVA